MNIKNKLLLFWIQILKKMGIRQKYLSYMLNRSHSRATKPKKFSGYNSKKPEVLNFQYFSYEPQFISIKTGIFKTNINFMWIKNVSISYFHYFIENKSCLISSGEQTMPMGNTGSHTILQFLQLLIGSLMLLRMEIFKAKQLSGMVTVDKISNSLSNKKALTII